LFLLFAGSKKRVFPGINSFTGNKNELLPGVEADAGSEK
jgi:hypothetical protein